MKNNPLYIDIHVLQTVPSSNINRDDTGSPKTAKFGGITRARVSSQAWKKAIRDTLPNMLDEKELGQRTKYAVDLICEYVLQMGAGIDPDEATKMASEALAATGIKVDKTGQTGYLLFISPSQAEKLARLTVDARLSDRSIKDKEITKAAKDILDIKKHPALNAVDIALFGRMVADAPDLNVDASVQVAHAIGISKVEPEFDYFTAMDDRSPEDNAGAGMIGTVEFNSSTLYRYATVDVAHLYENLGSIEAAVRALKAFLRAFVTSMPTGKQNTFANRTLPDAVILQARDTQPVSLVTAFEQPVIAHDGKSQTELACEALVQREELLDKAFGVKPLETQVVCAAPGAEILTDLANTGEAASLDEAIARVSELSADYLGSDNSRNPAIEA